MKASSSKRLNNLARLVKQNGVSIGRGLEKEGLRTDLNGHIAQTPHPAVLGHPLTHPSITTDYSEALLELITPVAHTREELLLRLDNVHAFVQNHLESEWLWAGSMPCRLSGEDSIVIGQYGDSNIGRLKHVYRQGLGVRYGRKMQTIAGLHYNFSLDDDFWIGWQAMVRAEASSLMDFKSDQYFALIRNFRRYSWLLMYLFGASPALDGSFLPEGESGERFTLQRMDQGDTFYRPYATSLRMGDLGYHNNAQASLNICFNKLSSFSTALNKAIHTPYPAYEKIGTVRNGQFIQLNSNILQIENEYYSSIRPKRVAESGEKPLHALGERGVEYIEVRCLDLNPFQPIGVLPQQIDFMDVFLIYCLTMDSPLIDDDECVDLDQNFSRVVGNGRQYGLSLLREGKEKSFRDWSLELLNEMGAVAEILDAKSGDNRYQKTVVEQVAKIHQPELTPSGMVMQIMTEEGLSWLEFASGLSEKHQLVYRERGLREGIEDEFSRLSLKSFADEQLIKKEDSMPFETYLRHYVT